VRRYDRLPRYLEGFLVLGDAVYTLNPIYAQGMTAAALSSQALAVSLLEQYSRKTLDGLAGSFQRNLSAVVGSLWHSTVTKEWNWPVTELDDNTEAIHPRAEDEQLSREERAAINGEESQNEYHRQLWGCQTLYRAFSLVNGGRKPESDLFEGIRQMEVDYA
jgi:hypothetical protein